MSYQALILAGGRATRMGGQDKGLLYLQGKTLLSHTLAALAAQSRPPGQIWVSANRHLAEYAAYGYPVLSDTMPDFAGPLAGVASALPLQGDLPLLVVPCDAVRLPVDFAERMLGALSAEVAVVSAADAEHWHPSLLALQPGLQASLEAYLASGQRAIRTWLAGLPHLQLAFPTVFPNLNTPQALDDFEL